MKAAKDGPNVWAPATHLDQEEFFGFGLAVVVIWHVNQQVEYFSNFLTNA